MDTSNKPQLPQTVSPREWMQEAVIDHTQCVLCGTDLRFSHKTDFVAGVVSEDAHCPACRIRNRQTTHTLQ
jgi:hypothetical protein